MHSLTVPHILQAMLGTLEGFPLLQLFLQPLSPGLILHYSVGPLLVQDAIPALSAPDDIPLLQLVLMTAVATYVCHTLIGGILLPRLGRKHGNGLCGA